MGFDTSHHPVDPTAFHQIMAFVAGTGSIDDLVENALRVGRNRFRANAWGLAIMRLPDEKKPARFEPRLHVWGRPFFITVDGTAAIAAMIDRYLAAPDEAAVDAIVRENLDALDPSLSGHLSPTTDGTLPEPAVLRQSLRANLELLRRAASAAEHNGLVALPSGEDTDAAELLAREALFQALQLAADARPGWMDRGYVWPTSLLREAKIASDALFESPLPLLGPLAARKLRWFAPTDISENYMAGGYVRAENVPKLRALLEANEAALGACFSDAQGALPEVQLSVRKLLEAVRDAEHRGLGFLQATEVYSGFSGIMN